MAYADGTKVHVQVQDGTRFALKKHAKANKISMNLAINNAIEKYLNNEERSERMQILVSTTTKKQLKEEAGGKHISVNELINRAIREHFLSEGLKKEQPVDTTTTPEEEEEPKEEKPKYPTYEEIEEEVNPSRKQNRQNARYEDGGLRLPVIMYSDACPFGPSEPEFMKSQMVWLPVKWITKIVRYHFGYYFNDGNYVDGSKIYYRGSSWFVDLTPEAILGLCNDDKEAQDFLKGCVRELSWREELDVANEPVMDYGGMNR